MSLSSPTTGQLVGAGDPPDPDRAGPAGRPRPQAAGVGGGGGRGGRGAEHTVDPGSRPGLRLLLVQPGLVPRLAGERGGQAGLRPGQVGPSSDTNVILIVLCSAEDRVLGGLLVGAVDQERRARYRGHRHPWQQKVTRQHTVASLNNAVSPSIRVSDSCLAIDVVR